MTVAIMLTRLLCIVIAQVALALLLGSWSATFPWWPFQMIAANLVGGDLGFESDYNELLLVWEGGERLLPAAAKNRLAVQLVEQIADIYTCQTTTNESSENDAKHSA